MLSPADACDDDPADLGELVDDCFVCIASVSGCRRSPDGTHWCGACAEYMPGYRVVDKAGQLTGYRQRKPDEPISPATRARIDAWLADHTARSAKEREGAARAAAVVEAGLGALPPERLTELLADAVASTPAVADLNRDLADLTKLVVVGEAL